MKEQTVDELGVPNFKGEVESDVTTSWQKGLGT